MGQTDVSNTMHRDNMFTDSAASSRTLVLFPSVLLLLLLADAAPLEAGRPDRLKLQFPGLERGVLACWERDVGHQEEHFYRTQALRSIDRRNSEDQLPQQEQLQARAPTGTPGSVAAQAAVRTPESFHDTQAVNTCT
jgi:hypothetical protein